ncbi:hypothetical protein [Pseudomonas lini]|nr:hypothetical protein [Pseudomonas lini]KMM93134.1 hypothetical protein TU81_09945 [Pseudomonas lini]SDT48979.1 hypothetical protein SAMN04490191_4728 [Pseudomonas lini]
MKPLYLGSLLLLITGCSPIPQYETPANAPQAQIRSEMDAMTNRRNYLTLSAAPTTACKYGRSVPVTPARELFSVSGGHPSKPEGFRAIEAGKPIHLVLEGGASGNRRCTVDFVSEFMPGARYVIKGGITEGPNVMSGCQINIVDLDSGARLFQAKQSPANGCALDRLSLPTP